MSRLSNKTVVDKEQELRPVRFSETGRMRLGKILKAARRKQVGLLAKQSSKQRDTKKHCLQLQVNRYLEMWVLVLRQSIVTSAGSWII